MPMLSCVSLALFASLLPVGLDRRRFLGQVTL